MKDVNDVPKSVMTEPETTKQSTQMEAPIAFLVGHAMPLMVGQLFMKDQNGEVTTLVLQRTSLVIT
jgi:hypothetical protein